jgi:hypothetical protein
MRERRCAYCGTTISNSEFIGSDGLPLCNDCFNDYYCTCDACNEVIDLDYAHYDEHDNPLCQHCWEEITDYDCPENPEVLEKDRESIIQLSRTWLSHNQLELAV